MTTKAQPFITESRVEAYIASALRLLGWLLSAILRFGLTGRSARLKLWLSRAEFNVESILFLKALALYGPLRRRSRHPRSVAIGFRRSVNRRLPLFFRGCGVRAGKKAGALKRVLALFEALANPHRALAYFLKRIAKGLHSCVVPTAPPADALTHVAVGQAHAIDDS